MSRRSENDSHVSYPPSSACESPVGRLQPPYPAAPPLNLIFAVDGVLACGRMNTADTKAHQDTPNLPIHGETGDGLYWV